MTTTNECTELHEITTLKSEIERLNLEIATNQAKLTLCEQELKQRTNEISRYKFQIKRQDANMDYLRERNAKLKAQEEVREKKQKQINNELNALSCLECMSALSTCAIS
jgi:chromosome segregation ATPase